MRAALRTVARRHIVGGCTVDMSTDGLIGIASAALTAFYTATACLALATLLSLVGALIGLGSSALVLDLALGISAAFGVAGVGAIVFGSATLVVESRLGARANMHETAYVQRLLEQRRK